MSVSKNAIDFVDWVKSEMQRQRLRRTELARVGGIDSGYVSHVLNREQAPGVAFCQGVAKALKIPEQEVMHRAGLSQEKPITYNQPGLQSVIDAALELTPEQRETAAALMRALKEKSLVVYTTPKQE